MIAQTIAHITTTSVSLPNLFIAGLALLIAGCLLMGFLTPLAAILIGLGAITFSVLGLPLPVQYPFDTPHTLVDVIILSVVILLLGPGAFSFDARMFGRREIRIPAISHAKSK